MTAEEKTACTWNTVAELIRNRTRPLDTVINLANYGDRVIGVFCGEPFTKEQTFTTTQAPELHILINFYDIEAGKMRIFDGDIAWFRRVMSLRERHGPNWVVEVRRLSENDRENPCPIYFPKIEMRVTNALADIISAAPLHDLPKHWEDHYGPF